jgi:outer membrane receptor protein involved in Fe transport
MHVGFTDRQKIDETYNYWGAYAQVGYFVAPQWQVGVRYDWMDRNGSNKDGSLNSPAVSVNYFVPKTNIKISGAYQYTGRWGHERQLDRDLDEIGLSTHVAVLMMQYTF